MPLCANYLPTGEVVIVQPSPADITTCALVIPTAGEWGTNPFALSSADGLAVAYAVVLVWGAGFAGRALIRSLSIGGSNVQED